MKKLFTIASLSLLYTWGYSQTKITFKIVTNQIKTDVDPTDLKLPLEFEFSSAFKDLSINILDNNDKIIALKDRKFGDDQFTPLDGGTYNFEIDKEGKIDFTNETIKGEKLKLKIENYPAIPLIFVTGNDNPNNDKENDQNGYEPGFVYYDALKIADENASVGLRIDILESYGINMSNADNNPYLAKIYKDLKANPSVQVGLELLSPIGNTDVTNFAAGLSRFLAERAKEELSEAFFNKMRDQLNAYPELETVFPQTASFLKIIEDYSYSSVLQVLKESFETDVRNLPENLYKIKDLNPSSCHASGSCRNHKFGDKCEMGKCEARMKKIADFFSTLTGQWVELGMFTIKEGVQATNPADFLSAVAHSSELDSVKTTSLADPNRNYNSYNVASSIELADFISQSLLSKDEKSIWINSSQLTTLFKTKDAFQIYLGLLLALQDNTPKKIVFYNSDARPAPANLGDILRTAKDRQEELKNLVKGIYSGFNDANNAVKKLIEASSKSNDPDPEALYSFYQSFTSALKKIISDPLVKDLTKRDLAATYLEIEQYLNPAVDMAYHVSTKKYSSAVYDALAILNQLPEFKDKVGKSFIKYGTLISTVASAESSDEVKKAIEASVLPAGSSAIKRKSAWSISVNAYVGLYYGQAHSSFRDTVFNTSSGQFDTITRKNVYGTYGLYAPIGLSFNRGFRCGKAKGVKNGWGITISTQLLDVGALVNFYSTNGDNASLPADFKVRLSDILSPGLQFGVNLPRCPITIMGGVQYVPALNKSSQIASSSELSPVAWRAQIGIVVDIPLYNIKAWDFKK